MKAAISPRVTVLVTQSFGLPQPPAPQPPVMLSALGCCIQLARKVEAVTSQKTEFPLGRFGREAAPRGPEPSWS